MGEMSLKLLSEVNEEPLTLKEAKLHLKQDETADDPLIERLIKSARLRAENFTHRQFMNATYEMRCDQFPPAFEFPRPPLVTVDSVKYIDPDDVEQTFSDTKYSVDTYRTIGRLVLKSGESFPAVADDINVVRVTFTAGYGTKPKHVPDDIRGAIALILGHLYEHRESVVVGVTATEIPQGAMDLLWSYRIVNFP